MNTLKKIVSKSNEDREKCLQQMKQTVLAATKLSERVRKEMIKLSEHVWNFNSYQSNGSPGFNKKNDLSRQPTLTQCQLELYVNHEFSPFLAWFSCEELDSEDTPNPFKGQPANAPLGIIWLRGATVRKRGMEVFEVLCKENYETRRLLVLTQSEANCEFWVEDIRGAVIGEKQPTPKINFYSLMYGKDSDGEEEEILQKENNFMRLSKRRRSGRKGNGSPSWTRRGSSVSTNSSSPSESSCLGGNSPRVDRLSSNIQTYPPTNVRKSFDASPLICKLRNFKSSDELNSSDDTLSISSSTLSYKHLPKSRANLEMRKSSASIQSTHSILSRTPSLGDSYSTSPASSTSRVMLIANQYNESNGFLTGEIAAELQNKGIALSSRQSPRIRGKHMRQKSVPLLDRKETVV